MGKKRVGGSVNLRIIKLWPNVEEIIMTNTDKLTLIYYHYNIERENKQHNITTYVFYGRNILSSNHY